MPVSDLVGVLDLRVAQVAATLDDTTAPSKLIDGVVCFLPSAAQKHPFRRAAVRSLVRGRRPGCAAAYPDHVPSIDEIVVKDIPVKGTWLAINFTAEKVEYRPWASTRGRCPERVTSCRTDRRGRR